MYENEADNETMLVMIGEYKELLREQQSYLAVVRYLADKDMSYSNLEPLYCILGVPRPGIKEV